MRGRSYRCLNDKQWIKPNALCGSWLTNKLKQTKHFRDKRGNLNSDRIFGNIRAILRTYCQFLLRCENGCYVFKRIVIFFRDTLKYLGIKDRMTWICFKIHGEFTLSGQLFNLSHRYTRDRLISLFLYDLNFPKVKSLNLFFFIKIAYKCSMVFLYENFFWNWILSCHSLVSYLLYQLHFAVCQTTPWTTITDVVPKSAIWMRRGGDNSSLFYAASSGESHLGSGRFTFKKSHSYQLC